MTLPRYNRIRELSLKEFPDIVVEANIIFLSSGIPAKFRIDLADETFIDGNILRPLKTLRKLSENFSILSEVK